MQYRAGSMHETGVGEVVCPDLDYFGGRSSFDFR